MHSTQLDIHTSLSQAHLLSTSKHSPLDILFVFYLLFIDIIYFIAHRHTYSPRPHAFLKLTAERTCVCVCVCVCVMWAETLMRTCPDPESALPPWLINTMRCGVQVSTCISMYVCRHTYIHTYVDNLNVKRCFNV